MLCYCLVVFVFDFACGVSVFGIVDSCFLVERFLTGDLPEATDVILKNKS